MCQDGARLVHDKVINQIKNSRLEVFVIWTPRYPGDNRDRAVASSSIVSDSRATHFWDAAGYLPREYGRILSLPEADQFAWDTYMIFAPAAEWTESPPPPDDWMHQMSKALGPNHPRWLDGDKLRLAVDLLLP